MATEYVGVRLDTDLVKRIDEIAETLGMTRSAVIDRVVRIGLADEEHAVDVVAGTSVGHAMQRAVLKALVASDFVVNVLKMVDDEIDPERVKLIKKAMADVDAKKKGKGRAKPALG